MSVGSLSLDKRISKRERPTVSDIAKKESKL